LNDPDGLLESRNKVLVLRLLDKDKLSNNRFMWQVILILGPLMLLGTFYLIWTTIRKKQFSVQ